MSGRQTSSGGTGRASGRINHSKRVVVSPAEVHLVIYCSSVPRPRLHPEGVPPGLPHGGVPAEQSPLPGDFPYMVLPSCTGTGALDDKCSVVGFTHHA